MSWITVISSIGIAYLLGTIPFGVILCRLFNLGNLRAIGSGNIGATNVLRTGHKTAAILTLIGDVLKGCFAVALVQYIAGPQLIWMAASAAVMGHIYPVWLKFQGGKGIATFLGVLFAADWRLAIIALLIWGIVAWIWRYSSLAALVSTAAIAAVSFLWHPFWDCLIQVLLVALIWLKHYENLSRLYHGTEPKFGQKTIIPSAAPPEHGA